MSTFITMEKLNRAIGLREAISMTIGTVVGVGLFTCGSAQIGIVGSAIIIFTVAALLISIWPCLIYGEMASMMPYAGGTYNYAKYGLHRSFGVLAAWHYVVSVIAIAAGEALAFGNYFSMMMEQFGVEIPLNPSRLAIVIVILFIVLNYRGIKQTSKLQNAFIYFFWACSVCWFLYMIPKIHLEYYHEGIVDSMPPFSEMVYIFGLVWWCYTGFEASVSMGSETKYPQYTIPRALKVSILLVFVSNAVFQWFLLGLVPSEYYPTLTTAIAPYADGLKAAGLIGIPIILLCIGIAFGGDLSAINPGIVASSRYILALSDENVVFPTLGKIHKKFKTPYISVLLVGVITVLLIASDSIEFIASVSLISLALCYIIGCMAFIGLRRKYPDFRRPFKARWGIFGSVFTIAVYSFIIIYADTAALIIAAVLSVASFAFGAIYSRKHGKTIKRLEEADFPIYEPTEQEKKKMDRQYRHWMIGAITAFVIAMLLYLIPIFGGFTGG